MKIVIKNGDMPERTLDTDKPNPSIQLIESQLEHLNYYKNDGRIPSQGLLDDIHAYEQMLKRGEAECRAYLDWRHRGDLAKSLSVMPRDYAKFKGWLVSSFN